jgi:hypothetical protein
MAQSTHGRSDTMSDLKDKASDQIRRAADTAEGVASRVADQGRQAADGVQDVAGNLKGALGRCRSSRLRPRRDLEDLSREANNVPRFDQ